ncbi:unnamed protein product [Nezara viridula]|uniref:Neuropeptide n=1 Tax=Nezara viridula TaxID=85310 RepID=A0A9P0HUN4_NEZVI|nr:unnamed protein product [Nezara viridula]
MPSGSLVFQSSSNNMKAALVLSVIAIALALVEGQDGPPSGAGSSGNPPSGMPPSGCPPSTGTAPPGAPPPPPHCTQTGTTSQGQSTTTG